MEIKALGLKLELSPHIKWGTGKWEVIVVTGIKKILPAYRWAWHGMGLSSKSMVRVGGDRVSVYRWYDTIYIKGSTKNLLERINEFSKFAGYKLHMQKSVAFLYTNNELSEREIKKTIPFTVAAKKNKQTQE